MPALFGSVKTAEIIHLKYRVYLNNTEDSYRPKCNIKVIPFREKLKLFHKDSIENS